MRTTLTLAALAASLLLAAAPAGAITGGTNDGTGHPAVGLHYFTDATGTYRCSNTLIAPRLVLTAAHCTQGTIGKALVTFDNPAPAWPGSSGDASRFITGEAHASPAYGGRSSFSALNDIGVIVLDRPATDVWPGLTPVPLATAGLLDTLSRSGKLKKTAFTLVGYGVYFTQPATQPRKPGDVSDRIRRVTTASLQSVKPDVLKLQENASNSLAGGGTCFGDSGGPAFLPDGTQVGITSFGTTQFCQGWGGYQRTDSPGAIAFLAPYLAG